MNTLTATPNDITVSLRLPATLVRAIDGYAAEQVARAPGAVLSRNRLIRYLLEQALKVGQP